MNESLMALALELAKKGVGFTSPNPAVGAVLVKNGKIISRGYHKKAGTDHAEIIAFHGCHCEEPKAMKQSQPVGQRLLRFPAKAGSLAMTGGATLYVTLEPCFHYGKTPPCVEAIIKAGIKKVCIGMIDPNKKVNGRGIKKLKKAGVEVEILNSKRELAQEIRKINQPFIKWAKLNLPYVVLKAAISLDGKIATRTGDSKWISGRESRKDARWERSLCDAVLIGSGTVKADNPRLAPQGKYKNKKLLRVIIDKDLSTNPKAKVYRNKNVLVITTSLASKLRRGQFKKFGIEFQILGKKDVNIITLLHCLNKQGIQKLFVEGGAGVHGTFYDAALEDKKLLDEVIFYITPKIIGGKNALAAVQGEGVAEIKETKRLRNLKIEKMGDNIKVWGVLNEY